MYEVVSPNFNFFPVSFTMYTAQSALEVEVYGKV